MIGRLRLVALLALAAALLLGTQPQLLERLRVALASARPAVAAASAAPSANKCVAANGSVLYSTEPCPAGTQVRPVSGGTVSTVTAPPQPEAPASAALRELNAPQDTAALRDKRIQQAADR